MHPSTTPLRGVRSARLSDPCTVPVDSKSCTMPRFCSQGSDREVVKPFTSHSVGLFRRPCRDGEGWQGSFDSSHLRNRSETASSTRAGREGLIRSTSEPRELNEKGLERKEKRGVRDGLITAITGFEGEGKKEIRGNP